MGIPQSEMHAWHCLCQPDGSPGVSLSVEMAGSLDQHHAWSFTGEVLYEDHDPSSTVKVVPEGVHTGSFRDQCESPKIN